MRRFFLTLMLAAGGGQPVSSTKCIRLNSLSGEGSLGCGRYNPLPLKVLPSLLLPKAAALFSLQQDNGQHCLYEGKTFLSALKLHDVNIRSVRGHSKAMTKYSLAAEDVHKALQEEHLNSKQSLELQQMVEKVFNSDRAVVYYDVLAWINFLHPGHTAAFVISVRKKACGNFKKIRQIKKVLSWVRSDGASICQQQISI